MRECKVARKTKETDIEVSVNLDGTGKYDVETGIGFLDHMMEQLSRHGLMDLTVRAKGALHIDYHHTTEATGLAIGAAGHGGEPSLPASRPRRPRQHSRGSNLGGGRRCHGPRAIRVAEDAVDLNQMRHATGSVCVRARA